MSEISNLDTHLQELAKRHFGHLEDQLYDPQPHVDGYGKKHQRQHVTNLLRDLAREAADLVLNHDAPGQDSFVLVRLNEDGEALCPKCDTSLDATIYFGSENVTHWHPDDNWWEYMVEGNDTYIESFACPSCGWSASYVEPREDKP